MDNKNSLNTFGTQIRKSPFFNSTLQSGCDGFSVYNHMYIPRSFGDPVQNYWNLINNAILCDVSVERQVQITGPDAPEFVQLLTPRNLNDLKIGQCKYVLILCEDGGIINDPVLLRLDSNKYWLSLADSDVLLWAKGVKINSGLNVNITEPDVSPLQLQGPKSKIIMKSVFGNWIDNIKYYHHVKFDFYNIPLVISRTGWSGEFGYEIFLQDQIFGDQLWNRIMEIGKPLGLFPGHTSTIRRIEGAMLSYIADMDISNNPFELGLDRLVDLTMDHNFIGKSALIQIKNKGIKKKFCGFEIDGEPLNNPTDEHLEILYNSKYVGYITSSVFSPRLEKNIAMGYLPVQYSDLGFVANAIFEGKVRDIKVVRKPFYDPNKNIAKGIKT